jgi:hypothetical protein
MARAVVALLLVLSTLAGATTPVVGSSSTATVGGERAVSLQETATADTLALTTTYHLTPTRPGEILVTLDYDVPSRVVDIEPQLPANATVVSTDGFTRLSAGQYRWQDGTNHPSLTYRLPVNETAAGRLPLASDGTYVFADAGPWALFRRPSTGTRWTWHGSEVRLTQSTSVDGEGVVGRELVFLGEYTDYRREASGQRFRLVVPEAASLDEAPAAVLDSYANASRQLRVGDRDDRVLVVVAPTDGVEWGVRGLHTGESDIWVQDSAPLSTPNNVWLHEYVHSRQSYQPSKEIRWVTEGTATYYAAKLTLQQGLIGYEEFASWLAVGGRDPYAETVLAQPSTWGRQGHYHKGGLVVGALDYRIRVASDGDASFETVFAAMNSHEGTVDAETFWGFVADAGNDSVAADGRTDTTSPATPSTWTRTQHVDAFGSFPAHVDAAFAVNGSTPAQVSGPYRTTTVAESGGVVLVTNETLELPVRVTNDGGSPGGYEVLVRTDEGVVDRLTGELDPGETTTETVTQTFARTGTYTLGVDGGEFTVFVREPAEPRVVDLSATPVRVAAGREVTVTATVANSASRPGATTVVFTLDGEPVAREEVVLDAGGETTVSTTVAPSIPGTFRVGAGGPTTVLVDVVPAEEPTDESVTADDGETRTASPATSADGESATTTPGFGAVVAGVAFLVGAAMLAVVVTLRTR